MKYFLRTVKLLRKEDLRNSLNTMELQINLNYN